MISSRNSRWCRRALLNRARIVGDRDADFPAVFEFQRQAGAHEIGDGRFFLEIDRSFDRALRRVRHAVAEHSLEDFYPVADLAEHEAFQQQFARPRRFLNQLHHRSDSDSMMHATAHAP